MKFYNLAILTLLAFLLGACKATVEGEQQVHEANLKSLTELGVTYPNFKPAIEILRKEGLSAFDAAVKQGGDKQADAMREANSKLYPGYLRTLKGFSSDMTSLRDKVSEARQIATDAADADAARIAYRNIDDAIASAERKLRQTISSPGELEALVKVVSREFDDAQNGIDKVISRAKEKTEKTEQKEADKVAKEDAEKETKAQEAAPLTCGYCSKKSPAGSAECNHCSAPF